MKSIFAFIFFIAATSHLVAETPNKSNSVERGRYLLAIGGCNDCHTKGFAESGGQVPETLHLLGSDIGFSGPWGVSYPDNLRLRAAAMSEAQWLARSRAGGLPPMPWGALKTMTDDDLASIYQYLNYLGPAGNPAPDRLLPGQPIDTQYFIFVPQAAQSEKQLSKLGH